MGKFQKLFDINLRIQDTYGHVITGIRKITVKNWKPLLAKTGELKNSAAEKRCYVIGLGPSLRDVDLSKIQGDSIVVNRFHVFDKGQFNPTYYLLADSAFFMEPLKKDLSLVYHMYPNTKFVLDGMFYNTIRDELGDDSRVSYIFSGNGVFHHRQVIDYSKWAPIKYNVVAGAIAWAIYLGYSEIILLGCDFNSFASPKAVHCYNEEDDARLISLSFELFCYSFAAHIHEELAQYAQKHGVKIVNATQGSLIDAYERDDVNKYLLAGGNEN